jgi:pyruvate dehydrogenase E1 component alpha subunit
MKLSKELLRTFYKNLYTIRTFENQCIKLYRHGEIRGYFHPYLGEEAIAVGVCTALREQDYIVSTHRGHGHCIARGAQLDRMVAELLGKESGYCRGRGGSMHIADFDTGNLGANGIVGGGIPIGVGAGLGTKVKGEDRVTAVFCSDGAANNGVFAESINLAAIWNLPVIIVVENNQYAVSTSIDSVSRSTDLYKRAQGYMVDASAVDGNDVIAVYKKASDAVKKCTQGKGPIVIEAKTYRHMGHHVNDPGTYMDQEKLEYYKTEKDPVRVGRSYLLEQSSENEVKAIEEEIEAHMEKAIEFAHNSSEPDVQEFLQEVEMY